MSDPFYTIIVDGELGLVEVTTDGFWDLETCKRFMADMKEVERRLRVAHKQPKRLIDVRKQGAQSREVVDALGEFAREPESLALRSAAVVDSALFRMQVGRIVASDTHRTFDNPTAARSWLLS